MADDTLHELSALYALDVLDSSERARFEEHLSGCEQCREALGGLQQAVGALGYAVELQAPPPELRERILEQVRGEGQNVVPLRSRRSLAVSVGASFAAAASVAAVVLGVWAASLHHSLSNERAAVKLLADPTARHLPVQGAKGELVVASSGRAALVVNLPAAPKGKAYEAWVIDNGLHRDRLFTGRYAELARRVRVGATVKVTLERSSGVDNPTTPALLSVHA